MRLAASGLLKQSFYFRPFTPLRCMSEAPLPKKIRTMPTIATHSGSFHCDEALGCWLLQRTDQFKAAEIIRSRDPAILATADIVIDVGGVYDEATLRFDHHQASKLQDPCFPCRHAHLDMCPICNFDIPVCSGDLSMS